jgi:hypothetical protein
MRPALLTRALNDYWIWFGVRLINTEMSAGDTQLTIKKMNRGDRRALIFRNGGIGKCLNLSAAQVAKTLSRLG